MRRRLLLVLLRRTILSKDVAFVIKTITTIKSYSVIFATVSIISIVWIHSSPLFPKETGSVVRNIVLLYMHTIYNAYYVCTYSIYSPYHPELCQTANKDDGLDALVKALPETFSSRFGEIIWARKGREHGWWPACIYDPRLTFNGARQEARENLGKKHLVFFFECPEEPFAFVEDDFNHIHTWGEGMCESFYSRTSEYIRLREENFKRAVQVADMIVVRNIVLLYMHTIYNAYYVFTHPIIQKFAERQTKNKEDESSLPVTCSSRFGEMIWARKGSEHGWWPACIYDPILTNGARQEARENLGGKHLVFFFEFPEAPFAVLDDINICPWKDGLAQGFRPGRSRNTRSRNNSRVEALRLGSFFCSVYVYSGKENASVGQEKPVGFVKIENPKATFADLRVLIQAVLSDLEISSDWNWRFLLPTLGPVILQQELTLGPIQPLLKQTSSPPRDGSIPSPFKVFLVDAPKVR